MDKLVSIILPVYNGEKFLEKSIQSSLGQTYKNLELIIVNDCSTDSSREIIEAYNKKDSRVKVIHNSTNKKLPASLNIGHSFAKGDYLTWTSDDNILKPNFLNSILKIFQVENCDVVFSDYDIIFENGEIKRFHQAGPVVSLLYGNTIGGSFMYKKKVFETLQGYDENLYLVEDYDFWLRASLKFNFHHLKENLYKYRLHTNSLTQNIFENENTKSLFKKGIRKVYEKIGYQLNWYPQTVLFFTEISEGDKFYFFKGHRKKIIEDIEAFQKRIDENDKVLITSKLNEILRVNLKADNSVLSYTNLFWILKNQPGILFSQNYSKKETLKLIKKFIF